jgi:phosphatidylglycerol---prolipoprotein diacylglyceryl transferase
MHSLLVDLGIIRIHWYGVMMAAGFVAALANWVWLGRTRGQSAAFCSDLLFWIMVSGVLGARVAYVLEHWRQYAADPISILYIQQGGLIFYGGFVAAAIAVVCLARARRIPLVELTDFTLTAVPLAHAFGRVGCFLNGCCYGRACEAWYGVRFPALSPPWWAQQTLAHTPREHELAMLVKQLPRSAPVHPVQLYEVAANLVIYGVLLWVYRRQRAPGWVLAAYLLLYPLARAFLETFRGDRAERLALAGFSIGQVMSAVVFVVGVGVALALWRRPRPGPGGGR